MKTIFLIHFYSLPYAFYEAGILLSVLCLGVSGVFSLFCMNWVLEVLARAEGVTSSLSMNSSEPPVPNHQITFRKFDFTSVFELFVGYKGDFSILHGFKIALLISCKRS
jgi:hypothetical protein